MYILIGGIALIVLYQYWAYILCCLALYGAAYLYKDYEKLKR